MIKSVSYVNFKGKTVENFEIKEKMIIAGKNRSGKTSILEAIEFALTGSIGDQNKNGDVFESFCTTGENYMSVSLKLDEAAIVRSITKVTKGDKVSYSGDVTYKGIVKETGNNAKVYIDALGLSKLVFSFKDLLIMSGTNRKKMILEHCGIVDVSASEIVDYIKKTLTDEEIEISATYQEYIDSISKLKDDALDNAIKMIEEEFKDLNKEVKKETYSAEKFAEVKANNQANVNKKSQLEEEKTTLQNAIAEARTNLTKLELQNQRKLEIEQEKKNIQKELDEPTEDKTVVLEENKATIDKLTLDLTTFNEKVQTLTKEIEAINEELKTINDEKLELINTRTVLATNLSGIKSSLSNATTTIDDFVTDKLCPVTNSVCSSDPVQIETVLKEKCDLMLTEYRRLESEIEKLTQAKDAKLQEATVQNELLTAKNNEYADALYGRNIVVSTISSLKEINATIEREEVANNQRITQLKELLISLEAKKPALEIDEETTQSIIESTTEELAKIDFELNEISTKVEMYKEQIKAQKAAKIAQEKLSVVTNIKKMIGANGLQGIFITSKLESISDHINSIISKLIPESEFFFDIGKDFNFGIDSKNFEALCGYEQIAVSIAMIVALTKNRGLNLLVLDEINRIDAENIKLFLDTMKIENCQMIFAGTSAPDSEFNKITL